MECNGRGVDSMCGAPHELYVHYFEFVLTETVGLVEGVEIEGKLHFETMFVYMYFWNLNPSGRGCIWTTREDTSEPRTSSRHTVI